MRRTFAEDNAQEMTPRRQPLRVLIADDHPLVRHSFRQDLEAAGIEVCAEAATGAAAVRAALAQRPDLCLLDMRMPEGGGIADVLFRGPNGAVRFDFRGKLPMSWPRTPAPPAVDDVPGEPPLFAFGYGLTYADDGYLAKLPEKAPRPGRKR